MTGMFYDTATHRIYYTVSGDSRLFYRYFTPESHVVGAETFTGRRRRDQLQHRRRGMTLASGRIFYGSSSDGALRSAPFSGGQCHRRGVRGQRVTGRGATARSWCRTPETFWTNGAAVAI